MSSESPLPQRTTSGPVASPGDAPAAAALTPALAQAALAQLAEGVIVTDEEGRITFVNAAAARLHGVARLDVAPADYADTYHLFTEDGRPYPSEELPLARAVLRGETVAEARWRIRRPDGSEVLAVGSARPVLGTDGRQIGAVLTLRDDGARAAAQTATRERDALAGQLREAFAHSPVSTVVYDASGRPVAANPAFERLWGAGVADVPPGYSALDDPQLAAAGVLPLLRRAFGLDGARTAAGAGEAVTIPAIRYDVAGTAGRGRTLWAQAHAYPVRDASGAVERVVLSHEDVTARREAEGALREALATLEARNVQLQRQALELEGMNRTLRSAAGERERLLAALAAERARLTAVFEQAPVAVAVLRGRVAGDLVFELVNPRYAEAVTGSRAPLGRGLRAVLPEFEDAHLAVIQRVLDTGEPFVAADYPVPLDRDGDGVPEEYYFSFVYHPLREGDGGGSVVGLVGVGTEVTDSVRARRAAERLNAQLREEQLALERANARLEERAADLRTSTATLRGFLDHAPVLMGVVELVEEAGEADIVHVYDNPTTERFFGVAAGATAGQRATALGVPPPVVAEWALHYREAEATGAPVAFEYEVGTRDAPRWLAVTVSVIGAGPTGRTRFTYVAEDATARKHAEAERERLLAAERAARAESEAARREAEVASRAKSDFLAVMSHELRTPLNAIGGYAELLELGIRGPVTAQQREDLARIQRSQRHLLALIEEVLSYARLESGAVTYDLATVPVAEAVAGAEMLVAPQLRAKGLSFAASGCDGLAVRADPDKLRQILVNLLSNAVKFTNARAGLPGRVDVRCEAAGLRGGGPDLVRLCVCDTGVGIAADQSEAVFAPFVQVDARLTRTHGGTGLGLAISRDLARGMGGELEVESTLGVGSTFTLTLPRA